MTVELETKIAEKEAKKAALTKLLDEAIGSDGTTSLFNIKSVENPVDEISQRQQELADLHDEIGALRDIEMNRLELEAREAEHEAAMRSIRPTLNRDAPRGVDSAADDDDWAGNAVKSLFGSPHKPSAENAHESKVSMRALFNAGSYPPETVRDDGLYTPAATRPIQFINRIRQIPTTQNADVYMRQDAVTDISSVGVTEGGVYNEMAFSATEQSNPIRGKGAFIPASTWELDDEPMARSMLEEQLPLEMQRIIDREALYGDGTGTNLTGLMEVTGVQTQAKGSGQNAIEAIAKAMEKVEINGQADTDFVIMHPGDWWDMITLQKSAGDFLFGHPGAIPAMRILGTPIYKVQALDEGQALVGAFNQYVHIRDRQSLRTYWMDQFDTSGTGAAAFTRPTGRRMLVGDVRLCITVRRPAALCKVTGI